MKPSKASRMRWVNSSLGKNEGFQFSWISWTRDRTATSTNQNEVSNRFKRDKKISFTVVILQKCDCRLQNCRFVHLPAVGGDHRTEFINQQVELVSSLLLAEISWLSLRVILIVVVVHGNCGVRVGNLNWWKWKPNRLLDYRLHNCCNWISDPLDDFL